MLEQTKRALARALLEARLQRPRLLDGRPFGAAGEKRVDDFGRGRIAGIHAVQAESCPHRRQAAERFPAREAVAAGDAREHETTAFVLVLLGQLSTELLDARDGELDELREVHERLPAEETLDLGFGVVEKVYPLEELLPAAVALARKIGGQSPLATAAAKELEKAEADFRVTVAKIDKAGARRVLHPNTAARRKIKLSRVYRHALGKAPATA